MNKSAIAIVFICLVSVSYVAAQTGTPVELKNGQGEPVGTARLSPAKDGGVSVAFDLKNLPQGRHAIHFHETAKCEGPAFTSAGGHYNPDGKKHGLLNPDGPHAGDMNNFTVLRDGTAKGTVIAPHMKMGVDAALVVHAGIDDLKTDPSGNAGDRIACGIVSK
ncbi:MAG: yojM [Acidobacteria bacterium]|nr:yojM [Acidobacteriota bacterium]